MAHAEWTAEDKQPKELRGYMYGVEYGYHLGHDSLGTRIFANINDIYWQPFKLPEGGEYPSKDNWPQDGLVEVEIKFIRHIKAEDCWKEKENDAGVNK